MRNNKLAIASCAVAALAAAASPSIALDPQKFGHKDGEDAVDLRSLNAQMQKQHQEIKDWTEKAAEQIKSTGKIADDTRAALEKAAKDGETLAAKFAELEQQVAAVLAAKGKKGGADQSIGEIVVTDPKVKEWAESNGSTARSVRVSLKSLTSNTSGSGGAGDLIVPQRNPGIVSSPNRTLTIRDILSKGRTTSNAIQYVQETGFTNRAATVKEGNTKPESSLEFNLVTTPVQTIAHWMQASKQVLQDVPALQSYIDTRLRYGLALVEEDQLLAGDGTGSNLLGLIPQSTPFDTARRKTGDTRIDIIRRAMTQVRLAEYRADAILLHPTDWEEIELTKADDGSYIWANPQGLLGPTLWGLPVIETTALEEGEFLVGNFQMAAMLWDREDAVVDISLEDRDNFIKNLVTIRAEERLALEVSRPEALIYGDFSEVVSGA